MAKIKKILMLYLISAKAIATTIATHKAPTKAAKTLLIQFFIKFIPLF